jgi:hypothetical protein
MLKQFPAEFQQRRCGCWVRLDDKSSARAAADSGSRGGARPDGHGLVQIIVAMRGTVDQLESAWPRSLTPMA